MCAYDKRYKVYEQTHLIIESIFTRCIYLLDIAPSGVRVVHGQSKDVLGVDDVTSPDRHSSILLVFFGFVDHVELDGQVPVGVGNDGIGKVPGNVPAVRLDVVYPVHVALKLVDRVG